MPEQERKIVIIKKKGKKTYKGQDGKEHPYINYYLPFSNCK